MMTESWRIRQSIFSFIVGQLQGRTWAAAYTSFAVSDFRWSTIYWSYWYRNNYDFWWSMNDGDYKIPRPALAVRWLFWRNPEASFLALSVRWLMPLNHLCLQNFRHSLRAWEPRWFTLHHLAINWGARIDNKSKQKQGCFNAGLEPKIFRDDPNLA
jgi:hypothetical protein